MKTIGVRFVREGRLIVARVIDHKAVPVLTRAIVERIRAALRRRL